MERHPLQRHPLRTLFTLTGARSRRASSWDRSGGNRDYVVVGPGETATLLELDGPGCITHVYCALVLPELTDYRNAILRCYWDGEPTPSVEVPLGDYAGRVVSVELVAAKTSGTGRLLFGDPTLSVPALPSGATQPARLAVVVVLVETSQSRLRFYRYQEPLAASFLLAVLAIIANQLH